MLVSYLFCMNVCGVLSQPNKPIFTANDSVDESDLKCAACLAVVDIVDKEMNKRSFDGVESRVYELMDVLCEQSNFGSYDFIPPKMVGACKKFMDLVDDEELASVFLKYYSTSNRMDRVSLERKVCLKITGQCVGNKRIADQKPKKTAEETETEDKHFSATVEDLMKEHGDKVKLPKPVKHNDEL